eukprot:766201-Hanusia_phi.AAC.1
MGGKNGREERDTAVGSKEKKESRRGMKGKEGRKGRKEIMREGYEVGAMRRIVMINFERIMRGFSHPAISCHNDQHTRKESARYLTARDHLHDSQNPQQSSVCLRVQVRATAPGPFQQQSRRESHEGETAKTIRRFEGERRTRRSEDYGSAFVAKPLYVHIAR